MYWKIEQFFKEKVFTQLFKKRKRKLNNFFFLIFHGWFKPFDYWSKSYKNKKIFRQIYNVSCLMNHLKI